jgi:hypothetical protein
MTYDDVLWGYRAPDEGYLVKLPDGTRLLYSTLEIALIKAARYDGVVLEYNRKLAKWSRYDFKSNKVGALLPL